MIYIWWKTPNVLMSTQLMKEAGLLDHILKPEYRNAKPSQLRLWVERRG